MANAELKKLHVVYLTMTFPAPRETFAANDIKALRRKGADVSVWTLRGAHNRESELRCAWEIEDVPISHPNRATPLNAFRISLHKPKVLGWLVASIVGDTWRSPVHLARSLILVPRVLELFERAQTLRPDVVHIFWGHYPAILASLFKRFQVAKVVSMFLGAYDLTADFRGSISAAKAVDCVFTHSQANLPLLVARGVDPGKVQVTYRGVHPRLLNLPQVAKRPFSVVSVGHLEEAKGMDDVLRAFAMVKKRQPLATLRIIGGGPARASLERLSTSLGVAAEFRGPLGHDQVIEELQSASVFLFLSKGSYERLPNVVKEAMATRCLCVVSDTLGMSELVSHQRQGFVVPIGNVEAAASVVCAAFENPSLRERMVTNGHLHLSMHFNVDRTMGSYLERWRNCLASRNA